MRAETLPPDPANPKTSERALTYQVVRNVPDYPGYLTSTEVNDMFHELAARHAGSSEVSVQVEPLSTPSGIDINMLAIEPKGVRIAHTALLKGNVHTNETAWTRTFDYLARYSSHNPALLRKLGARLLFIDADPGGMELNGPALMAGVMNVRGYLRDGYRSRSQVDWDHTWPFRGHKSAMPGAQATEIAIERYQPDVFIPLHNAAMGNSHTFLTHDSRSLCIDILQLRRYARRYGDPGKSETSWAREIYTGSGIYAPVTSRQLYDRAKQNSPNQEPAWPYGNSSMGYYGENMRKGVGILDESPYFAVPAVGDNTLVDASIRDITLTMNHRTQSIIGQASDIINQLDERDIDPYFTPLLDSTKFLIDVYESGFDVAKETIPSTQATVGDAADRTIRGTFYPARVLGQAARLALLAYRPSLAEYAYDTIDRITRDLPRQLGEIIPSTPREMVGMQVGATLLALIASKEGALGQSLVQPADSAAGTKNNSYARGLRV